MRVDFNTKVDFDPAHDIPSHSGDSNPRMPNSSRCNLCTGARTWAWKVVQLRRRAEQQQVGDAGGHSAGGFECKRVDGRPGPA